MSFTRKHAVIDPDNTQTKDAISNHIEEIAQIYEYINTLRHGYTDWDAPDGAILIDKEDSQARLYVKLNGTWKTVTPVTVGDSDPNLNEIQNYHLHYYPTENKLKFYVRDGDAITWTELYPTSVTANVDAIPVADSHDKLDKSWIARFNPIPLSEHNTENNKITLTRGDRAYLNLNGGNNPFYININTGQEQLFNVYVEWYDSADGSGCYLVPATSDYFRMSGWKAQQGQSSRTHYSGTTDRIWFGSAARGVAMAHITFTPWCFAIVVSGGYGGNIRNQLMAFNRYKNFVYFGSIQGGNNMKGRVLIERVW